MHPLPPLGITRVEAAEGETDVTTVVIGRIDIRSIEVQDAGGGRRDSCTRPDITLVAGKVYATVVEVNIPATDKSQW